MSENSASNNKRIAKNTIILYGRMLLVMAVSLYTSRVVLHSLGAVDYGLNNAIGGVIAMLSYVNNTLGTSTSRFLTFEIGKKNYKRLGEIFNNAFGIHCCYAIILFIIAETIGVWFVNYVLNIPDNRLFACNIVFQVAIITTILGITLVPRNAMIIAHEKMNIYAYIGIYDAVTKLAIAVIISKSNTDRLIFYSILFLLNSFITYFIYWVYCKKKFAEVTKLKFKYDKVIMRSMLGFTSWSLLGSTSLMARNHGITILINIFFGAVINAANAIAYQVNTAITNFTSNFTIALNPQLIKSYAAGEFEAMKKLIYRSGKFSFFLLLLLCYPVLFETNYLLHLWLVDVPQYAVNFTQWILILSMVEIFNNSIGVSVQATGNIKWYQIVISVIQLMAFPIAYILYKIGLPPYTSLVTMVALAVMAVLVRLYFIKKMLNIAPWEYFTKVLLHCFIIGVIALVVPFLIRITTEESLLQFILLTVATTLSTAIIVYFLGMEKSERVFVKNAALKLIRKR